MRSEALPDLVLSESEEALAMTKGSGFHSAELMATIYRGWARARQGRLEEGVRDVEKGLELAAASGSAAGLPMLYITAASLPVSKIASFETLKCLPWGE